MGQLIREDHTFTSGRPASTCAAWVYRPAGDVPMAGRPALVMAHGLGATREMGLDAYARRFAAEGLVVVVFDYRYFGASGGSPRELISITDQLLDWDSAIAFAKTLNDVDSTRIAIWGSSFGGGHAIAAAAAHPELAGAIAQCPFTDGPASMRALGLRSLLKVAPRALADVLAGLVHARPVRVPLVGPPGSAALMTAPDAEPGYRALIPEHAPARLRVAARIGARIGLYRPGADAVRVRCPLMVNVCDRDTVAPARATLRHVGRAPHLELCHYDLGHFDVYAGPGFERVVAHQLDFLLRHLKPTAPVPGGLEADLAAPAAADGVGAAS
jgi:dienelactone hydrolase